MHVRRIQIEIGSTFFLACACCLLSLPCRYRLIVAIIAISRCNGRRRQRINTAILMEMRNKSANKSLRLKATMDPERAKKFAPRRHNMPHSGNLLWRQRFIVYAFRWKSLTTCRSRSRAGARARSREDKWHKATAGLVPKHHVRIVNKAEINAQQ